MAPSLGGNASRDASGECDVTSSGFDGDLVGRPVVLGAGGVAMAVQVDHRRVVAFDHGVAADSPQLTWSIECQRQGDPLNVCHQV